MIISKVFRRIVLTVLITFLIMSSFSTQFFSTGSDDEDYENIDEYDDGFIAYTDGPYQADVNEDIQFLGNVDGGISPYNWSWKFGDENISYEQNPLHYYSSEGVYIVNLTVTNESGDGAIDWYVTTAKIGIVQPPTEGLVAYWNFDEGTGSTAYDGSGYDNDGTIDGATWTGGISGSALEFDGVDDYVEVGNPSSLDISYPITIAAWIKRNVFGTLDVIVSHGNLGYIFMVADSMHYPPNRLGFYRQGIGDPGVTSVTIIDDTNNFHHCAVTYDGVIGKIYIDGELDNSNSFSITFNNAYPLRIGACVNNGEYFDGILDEIRIYNRALSENEIQWLFNNPGGGTQPPKFLTLPFRDADIKIQQGWVYTWESLHRGIDYINGIIDSSPSWQSFDVVTTADGWAMWSEQPGNTNVYGKFIFIRHDKQDIEENDYFTLYAHLESVASGIPYQDRHNIDYNYNDPSKWKFIKRGETIGNAGNTGASNTGIHLHFEVLKEGYEQSKVDPYDIKKDRLFYPGFENYDGCGENYLWTTCPPNMIPSASFTYSPEDPMSGEMIIFDASTSYDFDGEIISYKWNFGDGETAEGKIVTHRYRGTTNQPRTYDVSLTVKDNSENSDNKILNIYVKPLEKTVEVVHQPPIPIPGQSVFARMTAFYNWIHDSTYVVSKIQYYSEGFTGDATLSIWDLHSNPVYWTKWVKNILCLGKTEKTYYPKIEILQYGGDSFEGIVVDAYDAMNLYIIGWAGLSFTTHPGIPAPFFETNSICFQPDYNELPSIPIDINDLNLAHIASPGNIIVYDSLKRITGCKDGEIKEEIPNSTYDSETKTVIICPSDNLYVYEIMGNDIGTYGLTIVYVEGGVANNFTAIEIPILPDIIHQFSINWILLSQGNEGVTIQIDGDGDGTFERTITSDSELTQDEFILLTETTIDINPGTLNQNSTGKWITCYIELPDGFDGSDIDITTLLLNDLILAETQPTNISDYDDDGIPDLMIKFDRQDVIDILEYGNDVEIIVAGELNDGTKFEGVDYIKVI